MASIFRIGLYDTIFPYDCHSNGCDLRDRKCRLATFPANRGHEKVMGNVTYKQSHIRQYRKDI